VSGSNEEVEDEIGVSHKKPHKERKWKPLECVEIAKEFFNKRKKILRKTIEEAKNLTKEKVNPQAMANPIIPKDMSNILKILLAI
jgi:16S rRNA A1518/A1519 N6-dimethyltransferase RsmA/KsgA/DIM1 with predicted DNA glycosylase/AP lyase activity